MYVKNKSTVILAPSLNPNRLVIVSAESPPPRREIYGGNSCKLGGPFMIPYSSITTIEGLRIARDEFHGGWYNDDLKIFVVHPNIPVNQHLRQYGIAQVSHTHLAENMTAFFVDRLLFFSSENAYTPMWLAIFGEIAEFSPEELWDAVQKMP